MFKDMSLNEMIMVDGGATPRQDDRYIPFNYRVVAAVTIGALSTNPVLGAGLATTGAYLSFR
jgi:hypothetical protein